MYSNEKVRRQDRLLAEEQAYALLQQGEYGILSLTDPDGNPYALPINYVWDGQENIYLHCAPEGKKLECIRIHPKATFCIVGRTRVISNKFTTGYESILLRCEAQIGLPAEERMQALELLLDKYSPEDKIIGMKYAEKSFHRTEIIRLHITEFSGKCKNLFQ